MKQSSGETQAKRRRSSIHPTAVISDAAILGERVSVGPHVVIEPGVVIGDDCVIDANAVIHRWTEIGRGTQVGCGSIIGGSPQISSFDQTIQSGVFIGEDVVIREHVTVHRSAQPGGRTVVHDNALLMVGSHLAHDVVIERGTSLANHVLLAGHVHIGEDAVIGGGAGVHQFVRVGTRAMVGGHAIITCDVPPYGCVVDRNNLRGLNFVGMRRGGVDPAGAADLKRCYRAVFSRRQDPSKAATAAATSGACGITTFGKSFLEFFKSGSRGFARPRRIPKVSDT